MNIFNPRFKCIPSSGVVCCWILIVSLLNIGTMGEMEQPYATPHNPMVVSYEVYEEAIQTFNKGNTFHRDETIDKAIMYYKKAIELFPLLGEAYLNLGNIYEGDLSYQMYLKAVEVSGPNSLCQNRPLYANALANLGHYLVEKKNAKTNKVADFDTIEKAIGYYKEAVRHEPKHDGAWYNLGIAYEKQGFRQEAYDAYKRVLALEPMHTGANLNMGNLMMYGGYHNLSLAYHARALKSPGLTNFYRIGTLNNMGETYRFLGDVKKSLEMNRKALSYSPDDNMTIFNIYKCKRTLCDWEGIDDEISFLIDLTRTQLRSGPQCTMMPYDASLLPVEKKFLLNVATANTFVYDSLPHATRSTANDHLVGKSQKLIVGYTGYDFNNHPMGHLTCGVLELHDRTKLGVHCYPYGSDDKSPQRSRIIHACDVFKNVTMLADFKIASTMSDNGVHIAVDLMAHTRGTRLGVAAYHPGAILVNYLGYPGTIGSYRYADYVIVDKNIVVPETARDEMSEKIVYLPHHYQANDFPLHVDFCGGYSTSLVRTDNSRVVDTVVDAACAPKNIPSKRAVEGIPGDASVVMCNFNTIDKLEQEVFSIWMSILSQTPGSVLWLMAPKGKVGDDVAINFKREAAHFGVAPRRIVVARRVPKFTHLDRYRYCDLFLDTFIYGAHSTASDALWAYVPIVTFEGSQFQSRVAADLIQAIGADELVVHSRRAFEDVSVRLAKSPLTLLAIRKKLAHHSLLWPLFDTQRMTVNLERSYKAMWEIKQTFKRSPMNVVIAPATEYKLQPQAVFQRIGKGSIDKAIALQINGNFTQASNIFRRLLEIDPTNSDLWHLLGLARHAQGFTNVGIAFIEHAIFVSEGIVPLFYGNLAELCRVAGDLKCALSALEVTWKKQDVNLDVTRAVFDTLVQGRESKAVVTFFEHYGQPMMIKANVPPQSHETVSEILTLVSIAYAADMELDVNGVPATCFELLSAAINISPNYPRPRQKLAIFLEHRGDYDIGLRVYAHYMKLENERMLVHSNVALRENVYRARALARQLGKKLLVIYCNEYGQTWWPNWGPNSMNEGGAGGSEEAVIFLSKELSKTYGYHVEVYGEPLPKYWGPQENTGVWWLPMDIFDASAPSEIAPDIFVSWRYHISTVYGDNAKQRYIWLQDISKKYKESFTNKYVDTLSGIFTLSHFHGREALSEYALRKTFVTPNALDPTYFYDGPNDNHRFIYASAPNRGLATVLVSWKTIKQHIPNAELEVYYGFSKSFLNYCKNSMPNCDEWLKQMKTLLEQDGINYHGMADHHTLGKGYARSGFYLYPTSYPETGCVALMKAQALGAIPITSRHYDSTLPELTGDFDLGPPLTESRKTGRIDRDRDWTEAWINSVVKAATMEPEQIRAHRARMVQSARKRFLWTTVAGLWNDAFTRKGIDNKMPAWKDVLPPAVDLEFSN